MRETHVAFVLGKRPRPSTVVAGVIDLLRADGCQVTVHLPHEEPRRSPEWLLDVDLVVQRGLRPDALAALEPVETAGVRCCNPVAATAALTDRLAVARRLAAAGVAVPASRSADTWAEVCAAARSGPVVVKSRNGQVGRGAGVAVIRDGRPPRAETSAGPWVVEAFVTGDGRDRKLYVAGPHVRGLLKASAPAPTPGPAAVAAVAQAFSPSTALADLATMAGVALDLDVYGVDVVDGSDGLRVIDVNPFPGFRGIPGAAAMVASHLLALAKGRAE